jgi:hypothetical protein
MTDEQLEQKYYEFLTRTDHPVFLKDFSEVQDATSPFNSILNRVVARQLVRLRRAIELHGTNDFIHLLDEESIGKWEEVYFGFVKSGVSLEARKAELSKRFNSQIGMSVRDVIAFSEAITGQTPTVVRNLFFSGWVLDVSALDVDTIFPGTDQDEDAQTYVVVFSQPVNSELLKKLDKELTRIEKGGCRHVIVAPPQFWVLDVSALDVDTILG